MRSAVIYNFLIEANIMASIAILLMIPLRKLLRKQLGNSALCFGWLLTAVRLLCPLSLPNPFIHEIRPAYVYDMTIRPIAGQIKIRLIDAITDLGTVFWRAGNQQAANEMQKAAVGVDYNGYPAILAWIWMAVCILVLLWFVFRNIQFRKALKDNRIEEISGELKEMYLQLCEERNVTPVPVYFTDPVPGACLVGILKPYIVLPVITAPKDVKNVLIHEICHLKNRDQIWGILRLLCCAIHWFNPLVWLAASMSRTDCELPGKRLKNRVMAIVQTRKPIRIFAGVFMIFAFACLIGAFATSEISRSWLTSFPDNSEQTEWTLDAEMLKYYATDQEALDAYGTGVWLSPSLKEEDIRTPFTVQHNEAETEWRIADKDEGLMLVFDGNGVLTNLLNSRSNVDDSVPVPLENQDTPMHKLEDIYSDHLDEGVLKYFNSFLGSFRPDLVSERNYVQLIEQWQKNDTYFAVFALRTMVLNEQGVLEKEDLYPAMIELEMYPEIRVVRLTTVPDQMINPGNG